MTSCLGVFGEIHEKSVGLFMRIHGCPVKRVYGRATAQGMFADANVRPTGKAGRYDDSFADGLIRIIPQPLRGSSLYTREPFLTHDAFLSLQAIARPS